MTRILLCILMCSPVLASTEWKRHSCEICDKTIWEQIEISDSLSFVDDKP